MKKLIYRINSINVPAIKEQNDLYLILVSAPVKVWNPVFTVGVIAFTCSMLFRGFLDAQIAVLPLAISTLVLFSGVWILSANGMAVLDKTDSNCYLIYKHLGYLQKEYIHPLTSFDKVCITRSGGRFSLYFQKDDGKTVMLAVSRDEQALRVVAGKIASFLAIPLQHEHLP